MWRPPDESAAPRQPAFPLLPGAPVWPFVPDGSRGTRDPVTRSPTRTTRATWRLVWAWLSPAPLQIHLWQAGLSSSLRPPVTALFTHAAAFPMLVRSASAARNCSSSAYSGTQAFLAICGRAPGASKMTAITRRHPRRFRSCARVSARRSIPTQRGERPRRAATGKVTAAPRDPGGDPDLQESGPTPRRRRSASADEGRPC